MSASVRLVSDRPSASALLSVRACAERARVTERSVRRWIAEGKLPATRTADGLAVDPADLEALADGRTDEGPRWTDTRRTSVTRTDGHLDVRPRRRRTSPPWSRS